MKKLFLLLCFAYAVLAVSAQEDGFRTIGGDDFRISGFGGPIMSFGQIDNNFVHYMGGGGGVIINNFFFGGYGMGKTNELIYKNNNTSVMDFGHGGFWIGYTMAYKRAIHPVIHARFGWGTISEKQKSTTPDAEPLVLYQDQVFVICPAAELEMNFSRFFKVGAGVSYDLVYNTDLPYDFNDFAHPSVFLSFKFGWFN